MSFVPEGHHDSSQARSAWSHEENSPVPAGRLNRSRPGLTMSSTVPPGRGLSASLPRHFVPGYYQPVPPGQISLSLRDKSHSPIEGLRIKLALMSGSPSATTHLQRKQAGCLCYLAAAPV